MTKGLLITVIVCALVQRAIGADAWKPAKAPLMTRWAKDVSPTNVLPEYPRPQMVRKDWMNLNGLWQFQQSSMGVSPMPFGKDLADRILVPFCMESVLSGVGKHSDHALYRSTFSVPKDWTSKRILLNFGAVDYQSTVYANGKK